MRRPIRLALLGLVAAIVVAVVASVLFLYTSLDTLVRDAIERTGSQITGVRVRVASVNLSVRDGRGTIRGLRVANPPGFRDGDAFRLGEITVQLEVPSLTREPVVVQQVRIVAPEVSFELDASGTSNIDVIRQNVQRYQGPKSNQATRPEAREAPPPRLAIREFGFEKGSVEADTTAIGGKQISAELPPVRLTNLGGQSGAAPDQIGKTVLEAFLRSISKAVAAKGIRRLIDEKLGDELGGEAGGAAKGLLRSILE